MPTQKQVNASKQYNTTQAQQYGYGSNQKFQQGPGYGDVEGSATAVQNYKSGQAFSMDAGDMSGVRAPIVMAKQRKQLKFPADIGTSPQQRNFMMFTPKKIVGGKADAKNINFGTADAPVIVLPIPSGLNTSYTQSWTAASVEGRNSMLADKGGNLIKQMATSLTPSQDASGETITGATTAQRGTKITDVLKRLTEGFDTSNIINEAMGNISSADFWNETAGGVASELGAMVAAGPAEGIATAAQYTTGMRALKQTMMSYGGPGFRSFNYNFSLKPFSEAESETIERILENFKTWSAPKLNATRYTRVYDLPLVFKIQFFNGAQEHKRLSHIGHCALSNIGITYGGSKFSTFSGSHAPTQVDLVLQFQEMELLDRDMMVAEEFGGINWPTGPIMSNNADIWT